MKANAEANSVVGFDLPSVAFDGPEEKPKKGPKKSGGFQSMGLSFEVLKGIQKRGYKVPTPIQRKTIPIALGGRDIVAMARTGSGKTACFLIPLFEKLKMHAAKTGVRALILSPTRELAVQTLRFIRELGKFTGLRSSVILGGDSMESQFSVIHGNPDIIVATPGRFLHLCVEMELKLNSVEYIVFDEADRLFEMGFGEQMNDIMARLPDTRQTLLFSATLPKVLVEFARAGLSDPVLLRLDVESKLPEMLRLVYLAVRPEDKLAALLALLKQVIGSKEQTAVFAATKHHVEYVSQVLTYAGISNTVIYSNLDPCARKINAAKFSSGKVRVLVVTDVAARGLDIPSLDNVINYNFPAKGKLFLHRVGRCARAGRKGVAYSLVASEEYPYLLDLHLFLGHSLKPATPNMLVKKERKVESEEEIEVDRVLGKLPEALLDENKAHVVNLHSTKSDLPIMQKVSSNAYKKYRSTRPGASVESVRRLRELDVLRKLSTHPVFSGMSEPVLDVVKQDMLAQMKSYRPKGTIFELGKERSADKYKTMKYKRQVHEKKIADYHRKVEDRITVAEEIERVPRQITLESSDSKDVTDVFPTVIDPGKRKREFDDKRAAKRARNLKDTEHYIPHVASDQHTEAGLSVNSFIKEANNATLDLTGDTEEMINLKKRIVRWDKKKKKMVQIHPDKKVSKIQTESGQWIPATYKTGRYKEWQEKNKTDVVDDESETDEEENPTEKRLVSHPYTHWGRHNLKLDMKKKQLQLRTVEEIVSKRIEHEKNLQRNKQKGNKKKKGKKSKK